MGYGDSAIRQRSNHLGGQASSGAALETAARECTLDELQEFLEADLVDVPVDLEFKEGLRSRLWGLVEARNRLRASRARRS